MTMLRQCRQWMTYHCVGCVGLYTICVSVLYTSSLLLSLINKVKKGCKSISQYLDKQIISSSFWSLFFQ